MVYHKTYPNLTFIVIDYNWNYDGTYDNIYTCRSIISPKVVEMQQNGQLLGSADSDDKSRISVSEQFYETELQLVK